MFTREHFFQISSVKAVSKYEKYLDSCREEIGGWFGINILMPHVFFIQSRKDYNKVAGRKTESWVTGSAIRGNIFILDPNVYTKESDNTDPKKFWKVLKHEYVHLYYNELTKSSNPRWLNEGLACYLAGQEKKAPEKGILTNINQFFDKGGQWVYGVGYFWVKYLIEKYGKAKLQKLLKTINPKTTKTKFNAEFKRIYGFGLTKKELATRV